MWIKSNHGWLVLYFKYRGALCAEFMKLRDNRDNRREAEKLGEQVEHEIRAGNFDYARRFPNSKNVARFGLAAKVDRTLSEFAIEWVEEARSHLTPGSYYNYRLQLKNHLLDSALARKRLSEINDGDVNALIAMLKQKFEGSPKAGLRTINMVIARLRTIFATARRRKLIADDPMQYVRNLRQPKPDVDPFDFNEACALVAAAGDGWERNLIIVLIGTGMRPNEALALHWSRIVWRQNFIQVRHSLGRDGCLELPKTVGSERDIEMRATVRAALQDQRSRSELKGELVFPSANGTPIDLNNFRARSWPRILKRSGVAPRTIYQCRHTFARLSLEQGTDNPLHVAHQLGHTTVRMVYEVYGRWIKKPESVAIEALDRAFSITPVSPFFGGESPATHGKRR
jgi:integrase